MATYDTPTIEAVQPTSTSRGSGFVTRNDVMTAPEVAELMRMPTSTVYELARKGVLPTSQPWTDKAVPAAAARGTPRQLKQAVSGSWREDSRQLLPAEMALWPRDLQLAVPVEQ